jgi:AcrR family transcriptional regulator
MFMATDNSGLQAQGVRDEEILKAALKVFGERGQLMRIEDVTVAVGIGKGTLYRHYDSRLNLLRAALAYGVRELQARAFAARDAVRDAESGREEELTAVIAELAAMNARRDAVSPAVLARLRTCEEWPTGIDAGAEPTAALEPLVAQWQADGLLDRSEAPAWITTMVFGAVNSPLYAASANGNGSDDASAHAADVAERVSAMIRRAFPPQ